MTLSSNNSSVTATAKLAVHPLILLSIADHLTRTQLNSPSQHYSIGLLYAEAVAASSSQSVQLQLVETVEAAYTLQGQELRIKQESLETDQRLFSACYPELRPVGFYIALQQHNSTLLPLIQSIQQQLSQKRDDCDIVLLMQTNQDSAIDNLPIQLYRCGSTLTLLPFTFSATESEHLTSLSIVQHLQQQPLTLTLPVNSNDDQNNSNNVTVVSDIIPHLRLLMQSLTSLQQRIGSIERYLEAVQRGELKADGEVLREIKGLCQDLPKINANTTNPSSIQPSTYASPNDTLLLSALSIMTSSLHHQSSLNMDFTLFQSDRVRHYSRKSSRHRGVKRAGLRDVSVEWEAEDEMLAAAASPTDDELTDQDSEAEAMEDVKNELEEAEDRGERSVPTKTSSSAGGLLRKLRGSLRDSKASKTASRIRDLMQPFARS